MYGDAAYGDGAVLRGVWGEYGGDAGVGGGEAGEMEYAGDQDMMDGGLGRFVWLALVVGVRPAESLVAAVGRMEFVLVGGQW